MRIRSIKPEFWRSDDITALGWEDRLIFIGLWSYVDDNGVGLDKLAAIAADLFAGDLEQDSSETFARVSRGLQNLSERSRIIRYKVAGKAYLHIVNWDKHQRIDKPNKARYPLPTCDDAEITSENARVSRESRESPATGTEEQRNRGTEKKDLSEPYGSNEPDVSPTSYPKSFQEFWNAYPRKGSKRAALKAWMSASKGASVAEIVNGAHRYAADPNRDPAFTKLPATWLNAGCWEDGPLPARGKQGPAAPDHAERSRAKGVALLAKWDTQQQQEHQFEIGA